LPALYRPDEDVTVGRAMGILHGSLDPHFADWPHLIFNLAALWLAPFQLVGLVHDQASAYLGVRILSAIIGTLTVLLVFDFARRAYGPLAGLFAATALVFAFLSVRDSHFATPDIALALACTLALYVAYRTIAATGGWPLVLNGIALGVAAAVKYNGALVLVGMTAAQIVRARAQSTPLIEVMGRITLIAVIGLATMLVSSPFLVLDPSMTAHGLGYIVQHLGTATAPSIGWVELGRALWFGIDPALVLVALAGLGYAAWRRTPADWILLAFILIYFAVIGTGRSVFFRYADPLIPPLLILGGRALADLVARTSPGRVRRLAFSAALILVIAPALIHDLRYDQLIQQTDTRTLAYDWLAQHVPRDGTVAVPYFAGPAHDQAMIDSGAHSHGATDPYVASFLDGRLETQYRTVELTTQDLQSPSLDQLRRRGIDYVVIADDMPGMGCRPDSALEHALQALAPPLVRFSPTVGCPNSIFDPIDSYYVPLAGYGGWLRPGPPIRIYRIGP
jgi:Dolichyl-phosphate-mannose-protein mannosyltransferase